MDGWKRFEGKNVYVILKSKRKYTGFVEDVSDEHNGLCFITILDKFSKHITFANSEIEVMQEEDRR